MPLAEKLLEAPQGRVRIWSPKRGIFCTAITGTLTGAMAAEIIIASDQVIAEAGWIIGFHDWWAMDGYDTATRQQLTAYVSKILRRVKGVHLLAQSKVVVMGINVANLVLHHALHAYGDRAAFEYALAQALK